MYVRVCGLPEELHKLRDTTGLSWEAIAQQSNMTAAALHGIMREDRTRKFTSNGRVYKGIRVQEETLKALIAVYTKQIGHKPSVRVLM